ncbi:MAG: helix-turn-helix transcriptional regulator [Caldilineaceae bacterium]
MSENPLDFEIGAENVFADLGLEDADELLIRARLGHSVRMILKDKNLKQFQISELLNIDQSEVSKLMNGKYYLFSESRLFTFLNKLDKKITVQISSWHEGEALQEIVFT